MTSLNSWVSDISAVKSMRVYTGNTVRWCSSSRTPPGTPQQEILHCIKAALVEWVSKFNLDQVESKGLAEHVVCNLIQDHEKIRPEEREDIKMTAKLFIYRYEPGIIKEAATEAFLELRVSQLDSVILALPQLPGEKVHSLEDLLPPWEELESLVQEQMVTSIGVSDMDREMLEAFCLNVQISFQRKCSRRPSVPSCRTPSSLSGCQPGSFATRQLLRTEGSSDRKDTW
ncbi:glutamate--cysteine ligase regulatory subunit-like isoform X3 [Mobula birostris]|uniref:glutamate--cysteine ligase regulatory subunit-like isoform X3 n=1 Tax=Mobula birostris TaxID=1983395 RepID=UPI003B28C5BC